MSRNEWHCAEIENFLDGNETKLVLFLHSSEVKRLEKRYPIVISIGIYIRKTPNDDKCHICFIRRKPT